VTEVYAAIDEGEREHDPERKGVAVIIEVDSVVGAHEDGFFRQGGADLAAISAAQGLGHFSAR